MAKLQNLYAKALLDISNENRNIENDLKQAILVRDVLDNADIQAFLNHPHIPKLDKYELLKKNLSEKTSDYFMGFLCTLVRKNRSFLIISALNEYIELVNKSLGKVEAKIVSAKALSEEQIELMRTIIEKQLNKQIQIKATVDPDVIGGFYILAEGRVFDATIRSELNKMKETLTARQ